MKIKTFSDYPYNYGEHLDKMGCMYINVDNINMVEPLGDLWVEFGESYDVEVESSGIFGKPKKVTLSRYDYKKVPAYRIVMVGGDTVYSTINPLADGEGDNA